MLNPKIDLVTANVEYDLREYIRLNIEFNKTLGYTLVDAQYQVVAFPDGTMGISNSKRVVSMFFQYSVMLVYDRSHNPDSGPAAIETLPGVGQPLYP